MTTEEKAQYAKDRYARLKAAGLCVVCGQPAIPGKTQCEFHNRQGRHYSANLSEEKREQAREYGRMRRVRLVQEGLCICCREPVAQGSVYCERHRQEQNARVSARHSERLAQGLCIYCGSPHLVNKYSCTECQERQKGYCRDYYQRHKKQQPVAPTEQPAPMEVWLL